MPSLVGIGIVILSSYLVSVEANHLNIEVIYIRASI